VTFTLLHRRQWTSSPPSMHIALSCSEASYNAQWFENIDGRYCSRCAVCWYGKVKLRGSGMSRQKGLFTAVCPSFASSLDVVNIKWGAGDIIDAVRTW
jgi:hypothetical protein